MKITLRVLVVPVVGIVAAVAIYSHYSISVGVPAAAQPAECFEKPARCARADALASELGERATSRVQALGPSTAMSSAYAYCGLKVIIESLNFCAQEYANAGKPECATLLDQQASQLQPNVDASKSNYEATSTGGPIDSICPSLAQ
jgi:hypothetical protein